MRIPLKVYYLHAYKAAALQVGLVHFCRMQVSSVWLNFTELQVTLMLLKKLAIWRWLQHRVGPGKQGCLADVSSRMLHGGVYQGGNSRTTESVSLVTPPQDKPQE